MSSLPSSSHPAQETTPTSGFSRRRLLGAAGVGAAVVGAAGAGALAGRASAADNSHVVLQSAVPFRGERQAGIITAACLIVYLVFRKHIYGTK